MKSFCLIGKSVEGVSLSKKLHDSFGLYNYELKNVAENELADFVKTLTYDGFNVTIPHKKSVMKHLDYIDKEALEIGSVNTVVKNGKKLYGYNTDIFGMEYCFKKNSASVLGKRCAILGSGGTSNTAAYFCKKHGAKSIAIVSRNPECVENKSFLETIGYDELIDFSPEVIINTTPVGMYPDVKRKPIDISQIKYVETLFDAIYIPSETLLVKETKRNNINAFGGLYMLAAQGKKAAEIFLGKELPNRYIELAQNAIK